MARSNIANYLGLAQEAVNRVLKRLQEDRILVVERGEVELLQGAVLQTMATPILRQ